MIRKNYSLSAELKKQESKKQSRIQNRQKHQATLEKLSHIDPIHLYHKLERARQNNPKALKGLEADWEFIRKHGLHKDKVDTFLAKKQSEAQEQERIRTKLWGDKSVYFNPELNPLGKVPDSSKLPNVISTLENHTMPLKRVEHYEPDPLIEQMDIKPPEGEPPKFYKRVYNTGRVYVKSIESQDST